MINKQPYYNPQTDVIRNAKVNTMTWWHERTHQKMHNKLKKFYDGLLIYHIHKYYFQMVMFIWLLTDWDNRLLIVAGIGVLELPIVINYLIEEFCAYSNQFIGAYKFKKNPDKYREVILYNNRTKEEHYMLQSDFIKSKKFTKARYITKQIIYHE